MAKSLPGRKALLFISSGIPDISTAWEAPSLLGWNRKDYNPLELAKEIKVLDPFNSLSKKSFRSGDKLMEEIIRFANSYNVSFYALDPGPFKTALFGEDHAEYESLSVKPPAELAAESWDKKSGIWSGIFKLDLGTLGAGEHILKIKIPVSEEGKVIEKEVRLRIFSENPL